MSGWANVLLVIAVLVVSVLVAEKLQRNDTTNSGARLLSSRYPQPPVLRGVVTSVIDGDTLVIDYTERVRLVGIDTPERGQPGFHEAKNFLSNLVLNKVVFLELVPNKRQRDRYRRLLAYVIIDEDDAGLELIKAGLARARYDSRDGYGRHTYEDEYVRAERQRPS